MTLFAGVDRVVIDVPRTDERTKPLQDILKTRIDDEIRYQHVQRNNEQARRVDINLVHPISDLLPESSLEARSSIFFWPCGLNGLIEPHPMTAHGSKVGLL